MTLDFSFPRFLASVRDHQEIPPAHIQYFIQHLDSFPDYQVSAFLAHAFHQPLNKKNLIDLTLAMRDSGQCLNFKSLNKPVVDKHSTGGIGDKISICLAPLLAALDLAVPMISGRGLGHTGGTLDKLEAIAGFSTALSLHQLEKQVTELGLAFGQQTPEIAPADGRLYALRDVTATVESIPLITASILSKKLSEGISALILDSKFGSGAFMAKLEDAKTLAQTIVEVAEGAGVATKALLTDMNQPLGFVSGNWCETAEAVQLMKNPHLHENFPADVYELTLRLAAELLLLSKKENNPVEARQKAKSVFESGKPFEIWSQVVARQGGDAKLFEKSFEIIPPTKCQLKIIAPRTGIVQAIDGYKLGHALIAAKAGRQTKEDRVDSKVSLMHKIKLGHEVHAGDTLCTLYYNDSKCEQTAKTLLDQAYSIGFQRINPPELIAESIG